MTIQYLADFPEHIPSLAQFTLDAWGKYDPTLTLEKTTENMQNNLNRDELPIGFVAIVDHKPVGMVTLKSAIKPKGYEDRNLWLGSHWVIEGYRGRGIGTQLLEKACAKARELGFKSISVWDSYPEGPEWYKKHGWKEFAKDTYQSHPIVLLEFDLSRM